MATTIVLVRHGETDWNRDNRFQGHADPLLNETGREQARALASELRGRAFEALYTSPLRRACETAAIVGAALDLDPVADASLKEVDVGSWSGFTRAEIEERFPDGFARWLEHGDGWDDGESYSDLGGRVVAGLLKIGARHTGAAVLIVTHGGPIRSALAAADGGAHPSTRRRAFRGIHNCAIFELAVRDGKLEQVD